MINRRRFIQASALLIAGKCRARVKVAFGNGSSKVETAQLIKTEKGWLVTFGL